MSAGSEISAQVKQAFIQAGEATGDGELVCALRKSAGGPNRTWETPETPATPIDVTAVQTMKTERDGAGNVRRVFRRLLIDALGPVVEKGDFIAVGIASADVTTETRFERIAESKPLSPTGVTIFYKVDMDD